MTLGRALAAWLVLSALAFTNGTARALLYEQHLGPLRAHQVSTFTGIALLGAGIWVLTRRWPFHSAAYAWRTGLLWSVMTVAFEFGFGRALGYSWERLLADYAFWHGRLWTLVPAWVLVAPALFHYIRDQAPPNRAATWK